LPIAKLVVLFFMRLAGRDGMTLFGRGQKGKIWCEAAPAKNRKNKSAFSTAGFAILRSEKSAAPADRRGSG
jgi:hypothetical protein